MSDLIRKMKANEAYSDELKDSVMTNTTAYIEQLGEPATLADAIAERNNWIESAVQFSRNEEYYSGLLDQIAAHLGTDALTAAALRAHTNRLR